MRTWRNRWILAGILLIAGTWSAYAQTDWEGNAVVARYGEFPPGGLYVASGAFPLNSMIDVTNLSSGESARLIVVRELNDPGVFLLLSETAASELGMSNSESATVRARPVQLPGLTAVDPNQDLPFHPDPDVNPAASMGDPNQAIVMPDALEDGLESRETTSEMATGQPDRPVPPAASVGVIAQAETEPEPEPDPEPAVIGVAPEIAESVELPPEPSMARSTPMVPPPLTVELELQPDPDSADTSAPMPPPIAAEDGSDPLAQRLAEIQEELAERRVSAAPIPPNAPAVAETTADEEALVDLSAAVQAEITDEIPAAPNPVEVVVVLPEPEDLEAPQISESLPESPELDADEIRLPLVPIDVPAEASERRVAADDEPMTSPDLPAEAPTPELIPEDAVVSLEPAEFRSPEPPMDDEAEEEEPPAVAVEPVTPGATDLPLVNRLDDRASYVQVAAFTNPQSVRRTLTSLGDSYPVAVVSRENGGQSVYRVYVGPLTMDEQGSALFSVRNKGFRDAFVRRPD